MKLHTINSGIKDSDELVSTIRVVPDPASASPDSDYGFTTTFYGALDSA